MKTKIKTPKGWHEFKIDKSQTEREGVIYSWCDEYKEWRNSGESWVNVSINKKEEKNFAVWGDDENKDMFEKRFTTKESAIKFAIKFMERITNIKNGTRR